MDDREEGLKFRSEKCISDDVIQFIKNIKSNSAGIDGILRTFKTTMMNLLPSLLQIHNIFLTTGVIPLFKESWKLDMGNRRHILILPIFSKIF